MYIVASARHLRPFWLTFFTGTASLSTPSRYLAKSDPASLQMFHTKGVEAQDACGDVNAARAGGRYFRVADGSATHARQGLNFAPRCRLSPRASLAPP